MSSEPAPAPPYGDDQILQQLLNQARAVSRLQTQTMNIGRVSTSWCWCSIGPHGAQETWQQLTEWVNWVRSRYPLARKVPPCWSGNPEIVEELTALCAAWQYAYEDLVSPVPRRCPST